MAADDAAALANFRRLRNDLLTFAPECLQVRTKAQTFAPFVLNAAQIHTHKLLEAQKAEFGWVRAMILKGRQQGISTYTAARYYHRCSLRSGVSVYILAHEQPASDNLFKIVDRYQRLNPIAPHVGISNAKELIFDKLDSDYAVATAGTKAGGRSRATSLFHGSEVAFWANAPDHFAASVQGIPLEPDTEVILESTSAGAGGEFYERFLDAEAGRGDYIPIFLPWWLSAEYSRDFPAGYTLSSEADDGEMSDQEYADTFKVGMRQMYWRHNKLIELRSPELFQREYPATPSEAWTAPPGHEPFINALTVVRARKRKREGYGPLVLGVDPASNGGDRFSVAARRGSCVQWVKYRNRINHLEGTAWIKDLIDTLNPARVNVDAGNIGADIVVSLKAMGPKYAKIVRGVNFGGTSEAKMAKPKVPGPANRRAEMWQRMADWLLSDEGACIPDMEALQTDITAPRLKPKLNNDFLLESKEEMKKRRVRSPDLADAVALTFAFNEYFTGAISMQDDTQPTFGVPEGLHPDTSPAYSPPPVFGNTGWMGLLCLGFMTSHLLLQALPHLAAFT